MAILALSTLFLSAQCAILEYSLTRVVVKFVGLEIMLCIFMYSKVKTPLWYFLRVVFELRLRTIVLYTEYFDPVFTV